MTTLMQAYYEGLNKIDSNEMDTSPTLQIEAEKMERILAHKKWLDSLVTQKFLSELNVRKKQTHEDLMDMSENSNVSSDAIRLVTVKLKTLEQIIEYAEKSII